MQCSELSRAPVSKLLPKGNDIGLFIVVSSQSKCGRRRYMSGGCGQRPLFLSGLVPVELPKDRVKWRQRVDTPICIARTECNFRASISRAGRRIANLPSCRERRHQLVNSGLSKGGRRALARGCLLRTFATSIGAKTTSHAPVMPALSLELTNSIRESRGVTLIAPGAFGAAVKGLLAWPRATI